MKHLLLILFCFNISTLYAQQPVFTLGEVAVKGKNDISSDISATRIRQFAKNDVSKALNMLPGISLSAVGPRNEAMVYVRGFDLRQVPLLIDGIPVYVPYDGYVDLARFTTFDIAAINVSKGYTSVLYGPNAMGGAINLISRKPVKPFEFNGATGWMTGGYRTNINLGSNLGKFYIQAGASKMNRDSFPVKDGWRKNSWSTDSKYNVKIAYMPNKNSEYALSYVYQQGQKGSPVYAGTDTLNSQFKSPRFWQWPKWDKKSLYFISNTGIDSTQYVKTRFYYDQFKNQLNSYDDATYSTMTKGYAFKSIYDDYTIGGIVEYGKTFSRRDNIKATVQYKQDVHREHNEGEAERTMSDKTFTLGVENEFMIVQGLTLLTGASYNSRSSIDAQNYNSTTKVISDFTSNNNNAVNVQAGLDYRLDAFNRFNLSVARKTRFATTKDRYSYRMGTAIPNPDLQAEYAVNYELGYTGNLNDKLQIQSALFYSNINNTIMMVNNVKLDTARNVWQSQLQNAGKSEYMGVEAGVEYKVLPSLTAGVNYTFIKRNNLTTPTLHFIDVPEHKVFGFVQYGYRELASVQVNTEYNSSRYSTTYGTKTGSFMLLNASASVHVWKWFGLEAGVNNITDKTYALAEGYPEPGRNYFVNILYRL